MLKHLLISIIAVILLISSALALEVNTATPQELQQLKGIGPVLANNIIEQRRIQRFDDWDDFIARVAGIAQKKAAALSAAGLTVQQKSLPQEEQE